MNYNKFDLIITNNYLKEEILKEISSEKKMLKTKIMTLKEIKENLFGRILKDSIYFLMNKYNWTYNTTQVYLDNIYFLDNYYQDLIENNLIQINPFFQNSFQSILVINEFIDPYILTLLKDKQITYKKDIESNYNHEVFEFQTMEDEVNFVAINLRNLLKTININNIKLVNVTNDYFDIFKKIFSFYQIPLNLESNSTIYKTYTCQKFIKCLKQEKSITKALAVISKKEVYNQIVDLLNEFDLSVLDDTKIEIIIQELKTLKMKNFKYKDAVECLDLNDVRSDDNYYFILGFNDGIVPKTYKDEDFFSDLEKKEFGLFTSLEKNINNVKTFEKIFKNTKKLTITYKLQSSFNTFLPSYLIQDMNLKVLKNPDEKTIYNYSHLYNKLTLALKIDDFIKYNELSKDLEKLLYNYPKINYQSYQNNFKLMNKDKYLKVFNNKINLSYSSVNDYFNCSFKYYIKRILKLEIKEDTISLITGNLFHHILSKIYNENFNFEEEYNNYLKEIKIDFKVAFFVNLLKDELKFIIKTIKEMEEYSSLKNVLTEKSIKVEKEDTIFYGIIDKIIYTQLDNKIIAIIIDYKTGDLETNIDNINYGLNLQLPSYIYLLKNYFPNVEVGGFYFQKILNNPKIDTEDKDKKKALRWEGFSLNDETVLSLVDNSYENSQIIKSLKKTQNGFYAYAKLLNREEMDKINEIIEQKIDEAGKKIQDWDFEINPKRINDKLISCKYCLFSDLCYKKEEDIVDLEYTKIKDLLKEVE